jgi:thiol-disulfide isomerase/thioredoxin
MNVRPFLFIACCFLIAGCQKQMPQKGMWAGTMTIGENKQLPFQMFLDLNPAACTGSFFNGAEQTSIPEIQFHGDSLSFLFSEYNAAMRGIWDGKEWRGKFFRYRSDTSRNDFSAAPSETIQGNSVPARSSVFPLAGKFQVSIFGMKEVDSTCTANFWMKNDSVFGTIIAPDGDYGLLAGRQTDSKVLLTRFTGWQAFRLDLERQGTVWNGTLNARSGKPTVLTLFPQSVFKPELKSAHLPTMKNRTKTFTFFGTSSTGNVVSSEDSVFRNKALIIDIMGTWCHNCMDAAPVLQQLYTEFGKDGLEIIGLAFEISDNPETAKKNLTLFQNRFGITYTVLYCGSTNEANVEQKLHRQLNDFYAYPTTLFVNKKGVVKRIHVGFNGPGTGEEYQRQVRQYIEMADRLVK